jgi:hypothetical protein
MPIAPPMRFWGAVLEGSLSMRVSLRRRLLVAGLCALTAAPATAQSLRSDGSGPTVDAKGHPQRPHQPPVRGASGESVAYLPAASASTTAGRPREGYGGAGSRGGAVTDGHRSGSGDGAAIAVGLIGVAALGCALFCGSHKDAPKAKSDDVDDEPSADDLRQNGPHVSNVQPFGAYAVYGFVRNGWPIVVDYDSDAAADVWISVTVAGRTWTQDLKPGRQYAKITYRGDAGSGAQPAMFVVQSSAHGAPGQPSRLDIIGVGAGARAVGSVAIENLSFAAAGGKPGGDFAHFSYQAASPFDRVDSQILHYQAQVRDGHDEISVVAVAEQPVSPQAVGVFSAGRWNGLVTSSKKPSHGPHRLQVRAWEVDDDASWVSALSSQDVLAP